VYNRFLSLQIKPLLLGDLNISLAWFNPKRKIRLLLVSQVVQNNVHRVKVFPFGVELLATISGIATPRFCTTGVHHNVV
jgi:hypothetical protein